ncbi:MAG: S1-like domain-containing RNA-binding protein [Bacteroidales bacterium]|nr:S1-like domain-containing RNA-binding protein [Bacteroidales bacterium]
MNETKSNKVAIGRYNTLKVKRSVDFGVFLDDGEGNDILMPQKYVADHVQIGDMVDVFVYADSEDRLVATTETPRAQVGEFAYLPVKAISRFGAFLDWGLTKDLLVPYSEQRDRMEMDKSYVVYLYLDKNTKRVAASEKLNRYLDNIAPRYEVGEEVDVLVYDVTNLGYKAIINNTHSGVIYRTEAFKVLRVGDRMKAYVKKVREDDKIDLSLQKLGFGKVGSLRETIIKKLQENGGRMAVGDKTDPETIMLAFGCSKKAFKMAIGAMYKEGSISIEADGIRLLRKEE